MTDEQIAEIYSLAREAFFGGQKAFQIQAYPFRMTPQNLARHRNSPHMAFWKMIKQGYDHFEVTKLEPKVDVCERHYVFNAQSSSKFSAADHCPAYKVPEDIANAVRNKQARDDAAIADLIARGTPAAPVAMGVDGGMNPTFLAAVKSHGGPGAVIRTASGTIPAHVNPPAEAPDTTGSFGSFMSLASSESKPAPAPASRSSSSSVQVASASSSGGNGSFFRTLFGSKQEDKAAAMAAPVAGAPKSKPAAAPKATQVAAAPARAKPELASASSKPVSLPPAAKPAAQPPVQEASAAPKPTSTPSVMTGAAPTVPSNEFGNRFGAWQ
jgi:hypothetical protein